MDYQFWTVLRKCWMLLIVFYLFTETNGSSNITGVPNEIHIPEDKKNCLCSWTLWMNSGDVKDDSSEDESYTALRAAGYQFCESPVDIQCYNHQMGTISTDSITICDKSLGAKCTFLCDDLSVRVACCYCPPPAIGPEFLISSRSLDGGCMKASPPGFGNSTTSVILSKHCNVSDKYQSWVWVSSRSIKNVATEQCLTYSSNTVTLKDCDISSDSQKWRYIDRSSMIQSYSRSIYIKKSDMSISVSTTKDTNSKWIAKVKEGTTSMKNMKYPKCDAPTKPGNGNLSCTLGDYVSSRCTFLCDYGYRLPDDSDLSTECTDDGLFSVETPDCERIECMPSVDDVDHGSVSCSKDNFLDSSCTFECEVGYTLIGSSKMTCGKNGNWNQPAPTCRRIICVDILQKGIDNGSLNCTNGVYFDSRCTYSCHQGFEMVGNAVATCQLDETWDHNSPTCDKIQCPIITASDNSEMSCTDGNDFSSTCEFSCGVGYDMVGNPSTTCGKDKTWSSDVPVCERKTCNPLNSPENGEMSCGDNNFYNSKCSFSCYRGYRLDGQESLKCTDEGWDFGVPTCKKITCMRIANVVNGNFNCTDGEVYGSKCSFACAHGYKLDGEKSIRCTDDGWSKTVPTCEQITCPAISNPRNGNVLCSTSNVYNSACYLVCDAGFSTPTRLQGVPIKCQVEGTWSYDVNNLHCKKFECRPISISQGKMTCNDMLNFNSTCSFMCDKGYNLLGSSQTVCTMSGWSAQAPTCSRQTCSPPLARPSNGQIKCDSTGPPVCTFSCDKGYELNGETVSRCQENERWSVEDVPICSIVRCPNHPENPKHGNVTCSGNTYRSVCEFKCELGYTLLGKQDTKCTEERKWDAESPKCQKISCPALERLENGKLLCSEKYYYKSKCGFTCDQGYKLMGQSQLQCYHNGSWDASPPYCERINCGTSFSNPSNGRVQCSDDNNYESTCMFYCDDGFYLEGSESSACQETGWTNKEAPMCKQITCPLKEQGIPNGARGCDRSNSYKSMCTYSCNDGYILEGAKTSNCTNKGTWSNETPKCKKIECLKIIPPKNGRLQCDNANFYGSNCLIICDDGYRNHNKITSVECMANKRWNPVGSPECEAEVKNVTQSPTITTTMASTTVIVKETSTTQTTTVPTTAASTSSSTILTTTLATTTPEEVVESSSSESVNKPPLSIDGITVSTLKTTPPPVPKVDVTTALPKGEETPGKTATGGLPLFVFIVIAAVGVLILVAIVIYIVWRRKSQQRSKYRNGSGVSYKANSRYEAAELGPLIPNGTNTEPKKFGSISMDRLEMEYNRRHADDDKLFREEYHALADGNGSKEAGSRAKNKDKNRYTNILPYDHSRVILPKVGIDPDSDYINASFVDGYKHKGKFIAAQGPKENTINDFWRMMWEQNVSTVIMATNLEERKEPKCAKYWPSGGSQSYGDLVVHMVGENHLVDFTIRQFTVQHVPGNGDASLSAKRTVMQYHFTSWPDFGVPKSPSGILKFLRKIKHGSPTGYGPIVVHCSAGVGRTGTFICIDGMMDMISRENKIDVFAFCSQMRQQRPEMVQTEQQYIFIYQAILEHHLYGDTEVEASEVSAHIDELMQRLPGNVTGMEHEFKKLTSIRIQKEHMRAGNHPANMKKNRVLLIFPYDWNRVMLPMKRGQENTDYINASYIDGYRQKDAYIATQGPLPHTTEDFWRMIWHYECASIVMLTELVERGQGKCAQYWPNEGVSTFGDIDVELISSYDSDFYTERDFKVTNISSTDLKQLIVKQFHYHGWPESGAPVSGYSMIELVEAVQKQQQNSGNHPIVVHCSAGGGRTGAFCALSTALEQVKAEGVLDMFQIVKCLRMQRPHMVQDLEQYDFCYRAVQEYIDSMSEYYNFK